MAFRLNFGTASTMAEGVEPDKRDRGEREAIPHCSNVMPNLGNHYQSAYLPLRGVSTMNPRLSSDSGDNNTHHGGPATRPRAHICPQGHEHPAWPREGRLVLQRCERTCHFCLQVVKTTTSLRKHVNRHRERDGLNIRVAAGKGGRPRRDILPHYTRHDDQGRPGGAAFLPAADVHGPFVSAGAPYNFLPYLPQGEGGY
ncbi:hypothetical protein SAMD00023353_4100510 [Rosellinia necatrix]|uniref:C2H2-type domain-containing protein n=1 Tax=Rosellinia necatrix TaxID=77044 RepID=A0A1S8A969_ROSNE|nr:hypothetical protein SAMD00023353_4100510 [Rosellinia necatrix]